METDADGTQWLSDYVLGFLKSPSWVLPIAQFVDERCDIFDEREECRFDHTACHNEFKQLVVGLFEAHLIEVDVTPDEFEQFCDTGLEQNQQLHRVLVEQLLAVDDFLTFKAMMAKHNADLMREVVTLDAEDEGVTEQTSHMQAVVESVVASCMDKGIVGHEDWHLYQEYDEQLQMALLASRQDEEGMEAQLRCEEAALEQAIALSLQLEEERFRQLAAGDTEGAAAASASDQAAAASQALPPVPPAVGFISAPLTALPPKPQALEVVPKFVSLEPLNAQGKKTWAAPSLDPAALPPLAPTRPAELAPLILKSPLCVPLGKVAAPEPATELPGAVPGRLEPQDMHSNLMQWRERAEHAIMAPEPARSSISATHSLPAQAGGPSEGERKQRTEHLKRQRDLLIQKRGVERQRQMAEFQHQKGQAAASGIDAAAVAAERAAAGRRLAAELNPEAARAVPIAASDAAVAAEKMRQTLTLQLRSSLLRTFSNDASVLDAQLNQLEQRKQGS